jgi:hypothetical protein
VLQVWFTGSHGDVGGGYQGDRRLADISLTWMLRRALESGHPLKESAWSPHCDPSAAYGARNDPLEMFWRIADRSEAANSFFQRLPLVGKFVLMTNFRLTTHDAAIYAQIVAGLPLIGRFMASLIQLLPKRKVMREIGGEIETYDGQYVITSDHRVHSSVLKRCQLSYSAPPKNVKAPLDRGMPVFNERGPREPVTGETVVEIDDDEGILVDRSPAGICIKGVPWLQPNARCRVTLDGQRWGARVAWTSGDRAGLALTYRLRQAPARGLA